jgi:hypothetical protein
MPFSTTLFANLLHFPLFSEDLGKFENLMALFGSETNRSTNYLCRSYFHWFYVELLFGYFITLLF